MDPLVIELSFLSVILSSMFLTALCSYAGKVLNSLLSYVMFSNVLSHFHMVSMVRCGM